MTRKELEALGLSKEQVDAIMKINGADIENAKSVSTAELANLQTEITALTSQVKERDTQLETLKSSAGDNEVLRQTIVELQAENTKTKEAHESEMHNLKVDFAVEKTLTAVKAKNIKAVKALLDLSDVKLDKDGDVKGLKEQIDKLVSEEDTKFLFDTSTQQTQPTFKGFQPGVSNVPGSGAGADVDTTKMTYDELCAYLEQNPDAAIAE